MGANQCDNFSYLFPSFVTSTLIAQIIHNTCFVCGGLMQDSAASQESPVTFIEFTGNFSNDIKNPIPSRMKQIKVRKCSQCGHSHT